MQVNSRDTDDQAADHDGKRLSFLNWPNDIASILDNFSAKDGEGRVIIKSMQLNSTRLDTTHDSLRDDTVSFTALLYYYGAYTKQNANCAVIERVVDETTKVTAIPPTA